MDLKPEIIKVTLNLRQITQCNRVIGCYDYACTKTILQCFLCKVFVFVTCILLKLSGNHEFSNQINLQYQLKSRTELSVFVCLQFRVTFVISGLRSISFHPLTHHVSLLCLKNILIFNKKVQSCMTCYIKNLSCQSNRSVKKSLTFP